VILDKDFILPLKENRDITEIEALKIIYNSAIFSQLSDYKTYLYRKKWQDIYDMLQRELSKK
jgi:hypothetical protein